MLFISYTNVNNINEEKFNYYLKQLPKEFSENVLKFRFKNDRYNALFGKILLQESLKKNFNYTLDFAEVKFTKYQKPYLSDRYSFNISHSGSFVVCGLTSENKIGIDIEKMIDIDYIDFKSVMTAHEWENLENSEDQKHYFFDLWTKKEAVIKANGKGLNIDLKSIEIFKDFANIDTEENENWYLKDFFISNGYKSCIASKKKSELMLESYDF